VPELSRQERLKLGGGETWITDEKRKVEVWVVGTTFECRTMADKIGVLAVQMKEETRQEKLPGKKKA